MIARARCGAIPALEGLAACLRGDPPDDADWERRLRLANDHLIGPRLYRDLATSASAHRVDPEAMAYLADLDAANRDRNTRLLAQLTELAQALTAQGITFIVLKGAAELVRRRPQGTSPRMLRDLDILIHADEAARTDAVLRDLGYDTFPEDPGAHSGGSYVRPADAGPVDVHLRLPLLFAHLLPRDELLARSEVVDLGGGGVRVPDASAQFAINLGHEMLHDEAVASGFVRLQYLLELTDLARDGTVPLDWPWIRGTCASRKIRLGLELQARMARHLGLGEFPGVGRTPLGGFLHRRRLLKLAHPWLGEVEWRAVHRAKGLRYLGKRGFS